MTNTQKLEALHTLYTKELGRLWADLAEAEELGDTRDATLIRQQIHATELNLYVTETQLSY